MVKAILFAIDEQSRFHQPRYVVCYDLQTTFWESQLFKRNKKELGMIVAKQDTIARHLVDLQRDRLRCKPDTFTKDSDVILPTPPGLKLRWRNSEVPCLLVWRGVFKKCVHGDSVQRGRCGTGLSPAYALRPLCKHLEAMSCVQTSMAYHGPRG